jgi:hypothetical protein
MIAADPLKVLLESLPAEHYETFVAELDDAIKAVCALARNPDQAGARIQALAELIRSWHLTVALGRNDQWVRSMDEDMILMPSGVGTIEDFRELIAS